MSDLLAVAELFFSTGVEQPKAAGYCSDCNIAMEIDGCSYVCQGCGITEKYYEVEKDKKIGNTRTIVQNGRGRRATYNHTHNYAIIQKEAIKTMLEKYARQYKGPAIPPNVIAEVAELCVDIDRKAKERQDIQLRYRGNNKNQLLAIMIYYLCIKNGTHRTRKEIAEFMHMGCAKFATGDNIVLKLQAAGLIDIVVEETPEIMAVRYLELFGVPQDKLGFIGESMQIAGKCNIRSQSRMISKTIGLIWLLILRLGIEVDLRKFEEKTAVRAATFNMFIDDLTNAQNFPAFYHLYEKYGVPLV